VVDFELKGGLGALCAWFGNGLFLPSSFIYPLQLFSEAEFDSFVDVGRASFLEAR